MPTTTIDTNVKKLAEVSEKIMNEKAWMISNNFDSGIIEHIENAFENLNQARVIWPNEKAVDGIQISVEMLSSLSRYLSNKFTAENSSKEVQEHIAELFNSASDLAHIIGADAAAENLAWVADCIREP